MLSAGDFLFFDGWAIMATPFVLSIGLGSVAIYRNVHIDIFVGGTVLFGLAVGLPCMVIGGSAVYIGDVLR